MIKEREQNSETFRLVKTREVITELSNFRSEIDSNLKREIWRPRRPDKRGIYYTFSYTWNSHHDTARKTAEKRHISSSTMTQQYLPRDVD